MIKTCNLATVKNTQSEALQRAQYYYIKTVSTPEHDSDMQYKSVQCIIDMIYEVLNYSNLSIFNNAVVFGVYDDNIVKPLLMFKNDVIKHSFTIINLTRKKSSCI